MFYLEEMEGKYSSNFPYYLSALQTSYQLTKERSVIKLLRNQSSFAFPFSNYITCVEVSFQFKGIETEILCME